jgi:nicotinamidase-related amidase
MSASTTRPADIVSPTSDGVLPTRVSIKDAQAAGRRGYDKPTPQNSIMLLVDHQMGLMLGMRDTTSLSQLVSNIVGLARTAKALNIPTLLTTSNAQWQNGDTLQELKDIFPDQPIYRRTGIINCYEDPTFRSALEKIVESTGRRHIIIAAVTIGTCCLMPTLSMLNDGYAVYPVIDACGGWSKYEVDAASSRMAAAGAELCSTFALACELQADWKLPSGQAMFEPFVKNLPEYGFAVTPFWSRVAGEAVKDPFGMAK